jgi:hypothetical protein
MRTTAKVVSMRRANDKKGKGTMYRVPRLRLFLWGTVAALVSMPAIATAAGANAARVDAGPTPSTLPIVHITLQYLRVIVPADPANPPTEPPAILPTITCERFAGGQRQTVFGYQHVGERSYDSAIGLPSQSARGYDYFFDGTTPVADLGQLDEFLPGNHPSRFEVSTANHPTWVLEVPGIGQEQPADAAKGMWRVIITPLFPTPCGPTVPQHFVSMRGEGGARPTPADVVRDTSGRITQYALDFPVTGDQTICSPGGVPLEPRVLYGYTETNYVPLLASQIVRVDTLDSQAFTRTAVASRQVADAAAPSGGRIILDSYGRCRFGNSLVEAPDPRYGGNDDGSFWGVFPNADDTQLVVELFVPGGGVRFR